jgi:hypothetical protein
MSNPFRYFINSQEVIRLVVMTFVRYPLSLRAVEDLLAERGVASILVFIAHDPEEMVQWRYAIFDFLLTDAARHDLRSLRSYSIAPIVARVIRVRAAIGRFGARASAVKSPCFRAFLLPLGAPPVAPCIRHTSRPRTAGARHCSPLRFDLARHLDARCIGQCIGLFSIFSAHPSPLGWGADVADDRLPAHLGLAHVNVLRTTRGFPR